MDTRIQLFDYVTTQYQRLCEDCGEPIKLNVIWQLNGSLVTCDTYKKDNYGKPLNISKRHKNVPRSWQYNEGIIHFEQLDEIKSEINTTFIKDRLSQHPRGYTHNLDCLFITLGDIARKASGTLESTSNVLYNLKFINEPKKSLPFYCLTNTDTIQPVSLILEN